MTMQATPGQLVGQRVRRREDPRLVTGRGNYVDDMKLPGMLHLAFKRSDVAHGIIRSIDTSAAEAMPGVELVLTGAQLVEMIPPMPVATPFPAPDHHSVPRTACATSVSRSQSSWRPIASWPPTPPTRSSWTSRNCPRSSTRSGR